MTFLFKERYNEITQLAEITINESVLDGGTNMISLSITYMYIEILDL